jgi:tRNA pseudouridine55 synthase
VNGILNLDKPAGASSARLVARVKRLLPRNPGGTKIGHAGTLDPFATGVLLLLVGKATKSCELLMDASKQYEAVVRFGATTETDDPESPPVPWVPAGGGHPSPPTREAVEAALPAFVGQILQRPPAYSALKVGGRRAYDLARKGEELALEARPVRVYGIELLEYAWPRLALRIDCGRGTYIRSIARDLGQALDVGGHLSELRRTRVGPFGVERAVKPETLEHDGVAAHLHPVPAAGS